MNNLSSYCGLVDAKIRASDKDLPVYEKLRLVLETKVPQSSQTLKFGKI